mmetsp:Transcript_25552/g.64084  ORF Transcript_25552/g.64084 Transcript_25552/m.64084 type:complete len:204 (-) Transcript_25552:160-771(-)
MRGVVTSSCLPTPSCPCLFLPNVYILPFEQRTAECNSPHSTCTTTLEERASTSFGTSASSLLFSPVAPHFPMPIDDTAPSSCCTSVWYAPHATLTAHVRLSAFTTLGEVNVSAAPCPHCPNCDSPHASTTPPSAITAVCASPHATHDILLVERASMIVGRGTLSSFDGTPHWCDSLRPHTATSPSRRRATEWPKPAAHCAIPP